MFYNWKKNYSKSVEKMHLTNYYANLYSHRSINIDIFDELKFKNMVLYVQQ